MTNLELDDIQSGVLRARTTEKAWKISGGISPLQRDQLVSKYQRRIRMANTDPMTAVRQYIDHFNNGDADGMGATFAVNGSILDGMSPHLWVGPSATQDWYRDVLIEGKEHGASDYFVTLGEPLHNNTTGDAAYVTVPATMTF